MSYEFNLGKGKYFSIAKASLIFWFEEMDKDYKFLDYGRPDDMHRIVDIAGCKHISFMTPTAVTNRLSSSPFWESKNCNYLYSGIGNGKCSGFIPSQKGIDYYNDVLSKRAKEDI